MKSIIFLFLCSNALILAKDPRTAPVSPDLTITPTTATPAIQSTVTFFPEPSSHPNPPNTTTTTTTTSNPTNTTTTSTTSKPITTTTPSSTTSTTTARPIPDVNPPVNNYTLNYTTSNTNESRVCLLMSVAMQLEIPPAKNSSLNSTKINVPSNVTTYGTCKPGVHIENITVSWNNYLVDLGFNKTEKGIYDWDTIDFTVPIDSNHTIYRWNRPLFPTNIDKSYRCLKEQIFELQTLEKLKAYLHITNLHYQAFMNNTKNQFDSAHDCEGPIITTDVVPIVVGCVLAILVILVLVAYLYGRRRSQAGGYLSISVPAMPQIQSLGNIFSFANVKYLRGTNLLPPLLVPTGLSSKQRSSELNPSPT